VDEFKITIEKNHIGNYLVFRYSNSVYMEDDNICKFLDITKEYYEEIMFKTLKAEKLKGGIYFNSIDSAFEAAEWFEENIFPFLIAKKLIGDL
jgi:hypothetical protein